MCHNLKPYNIRICCNESILFLDEKKFCSDIQTENWFLFAYIQQKMHKRYLLDDPTIEVRIQLCLSMCLHPYQRWQRAPAVRGNKERENGG
uniref:Uncharacterized protein n=1 Tax=Arion vulgaris TaxID=1028688 RepID=A0A0B7BCA7_9EUPU